MSDFLESLSNAIGVTDSVFCLIMTFLSVIVAFVLGRIAVVKFPFENMVESGEGIGSFCNLIGVLYAIVLGYVLVNVYESYSMASERVEAEASLLIDLLRDAEGLPPIQGLILRKATVNYMDSVIDVEWPYMIKNRDYHPETFDRFSAIYKTVKQIKCDSDEQRLFLGEIIVRLNELSATRRERIQVASSRVPDMLWAMLLGVGFVNFSMTFIFPVERPKLRITLLCSTAAVMTFTTLLIFILDRPYNGTLGIKPDSLIKVREIIQKRGKPEQWDQDPGVASARPKLEMLKKAVEKAKHSN